MKVCQNTRYVFIGSHLLNAPLWAMYTLLVFIFYKDLHASPLQITLLISSKPVVAIASFYWNSFVEKRHDLLKKSIGCASVIGLLPCFFFPFIDNNWFYIFAFAVYMMASRAIIPAWMEILKIKIHAEARSKIFSIGSSINYLTSLFFPLFISRWMDNSPGIWRWGFFIAAGISLLSNFLLVTIPLPQEKPPPLNDKQNLKDTLVQPWRNFIKLMRARPDFAHFQLIFMCGGLGLMIMQPALPVFTLEVLHLSYTELVIAISVCKGIGFALTTRIWALFFNKINIYILTFLICFLATLFPIFLITASLHWIWVYVAYFVYGIMQAGSEMCWNLSGPRFARKENSAAFTGINVVLVGLRGCVGPFLGGYLGFIANSYLPLIVGGFFCLCGTGCAIYSSKKYAEKELLSKPS
jgi:predicted MFS family arabinose efflux permease